MSMDRVYDDSDIVMGGESTGHVGMKISLTRMQVDLDKENGELLLWFPSQLMSGDVHERIEALADDLGLDRKDWNLFHDELVDIATSYQIRAELARREIKW